MRKLVNGKYVAIGDQPVRAGKAEKVAGKVTYSLVQKGGGYFNVIGSDGKLATPKALRKENAQALADRLNAPEGE